MISLQECETDRYRRRTGVVTTGVETIIEIVKCDAADTSGSGTYAQQTCGKHEIVI